MSESELNKLIRTYQIKASIILMAALIIAIFSHSFLINSAIDRHFELGLPYTS
jgi:hypothetical protein